MTRADLKNEQPVARIGRVRWTVSIALFVSVFIAFLDRLNISLALPQLAEHFGWSTEEIGANGSLLMGSFYIAYGISNMVLTPIAAHFGVRKSLMTVVVLFSIFTMLGAPLSFSLGLFVGTRVLLGLSEGVHFPMMSAATKYWFPLHERSRANGIWTSGGMVATILAPLILVPVIDHWGWEVMLYGCGILGMLITLPVLYLFLYDDPRSAKRITQKEIDYIEAGRETGEDTTPNWNFLRRSPFWLAAASGALSNYCIVGVLSWMPIYFVKAKGIDFSDLAYAASLPYVTGLVAFVVYAFLGDIFNRRIRMASIGFFGTALSVYAATTAPNLPLTLLGFAVGTFCLIAFTSQEFAIVQRILPAASIGKATGVYNGFAVLFGSVGGTLLLGQIIAWTGSYDAGMYSIVGAAILGSLTTFALSRKIQY